MCFAYFGWGNLEENISKQHPLLYHPQWVETRAISPNIENQSIAIGHIKTCSISAATLFELQTTKEI